MGSISFKFISKAIIVSCIFSVAAYVSLRYHQTTKVATPSVPLVTQKIKGAPFISIKRPFQGQGDSNSTIEVAEGQEDSSWMSSILNALNDPNLKVRVRAVRSLKDHPTPESVGLLCKFLKDKDSVVVRAAIDTLGHLGLNSDQKDAVFDVLSQKALDKNFSHRGDALTMAAVIGKDRLLPVISSFIFEDEKDQGAKDYAVRALSFIDSPACIPLLEEVLSAETKDPNIHQVAFDTLASINTPEALALLEEYVVFSKGVDQATSAQALARLNNQKFNQMFSNELEREALDEDTIEALAKSPAAPEIFGELLRVIPEKEKKISWLRRLAMYASGGKSETRSGVSSAIVPLLDNTDPEIQVEAIKALGQIGGEDVADSLIEKLDTDEPDDIRREALIALWPYATPENYKPLLDMVWDENQEIRRTALIVAEQFIKESDRPLLEKATEHPDEVVRQQVTTILKLMDTEKKLEGKDLS